MTKHLVDIDDGLLEQARELSDSETIRGTVEEALRKLIRIEASRRHIQELGGALELDAIQLLDGARQVPRPDSGLPD